MRLKQPPDISKTPQEFSLSKYDACNQWGAMEWYKALFKRAMMRSLHKHNGSDDRQYHKSEAMSFILNPLMQDDSLHRPALSPIRDQTVEEFFRGNNLVCDEAAYRSWYERQKSAAELHCLPDEDPFLDANINTFAEVCFQPAWEMHRQLLPPLPLQSNERFFISVDLSAPDIFLVECFQSWIKETRAKAIVSSRKHIFEEKNFNKWHTRRLLPYLDLNFWAEANQVRFYQPQYLSILFGDSTNHDETIISDVKTEAFALLSDANISSLKSQAYHLR